MLVDLDVGNTQPSHCLMAPNGQGRTVDETSHVSHQFTHNYLNSCLMSQTFDNEALHRKPRLSKSGSFPAASSSRVRCQGPTKLNRKQREIWPQSQGKGFANMLRERDTEESIQGIGPSSKGNKKLYQRKQGSCLRVFRRGLSLSELDYSSFLPNMDSKDENSGKTGVEDDEVCNIRLLTLEECESGLQFHDITSSLEKGENVEIYEPFPLIQQADDESSFEFYYVKQVLEMSGFIRKDHIQSCIWYSFQEPLNPDIFEELETSYNYVDRLESSIKNEESKRVRKLIFDLINEALLYINERPYLYYPKALSFKCHLYPIPKGQDLLDEVWELVGKSLLNRRPDKDNLLAYAIVESSRGGWMNLQIESEFTAVEAEDLILDQLLNEVVLAC